jgi:ribosomal protein L37E
MGLIMGMFKQALGSKMAGSENRWVKGMGKALGGEEQSYGTCPRCGGKLNASGICRSCGWTRSKATREGKE